MSATKTTSYFLSKFLQVSWLISLELNKLFYCIFLLRSTPQYLKLEQNVYDLLSVEEFSRNKVYKLGLI